MANEIISRDCYKKIKGYNRQMLNVWLSMFGCEIYNDGCRDAAVAEIMALRDEFGFGTQRIARFMKKRDGVIQAINAKEFTIVEAIEQMQKEGLSIRTDFIPDVRKVKEVDKSEVE